MSAYKWETKQLKMKQRRSHNLSYPGVHFTCPHHCLVSAATSDSVTVDLKNASLGTCWDCMEDAHELHPFRK